MNRGPVLPPPEPVDVGLVAALPIEVGSLLDLLSDSREYRATADRPFRTIEGILSAKRLAIIVGGTGRKAAALATRRLIVGHRPRLILSAGFGGALDPSLKRGDTILVHQVLRPPTDEQPPERIDLGLLLEHDSRSTTHRQRTRSGILVTADRILRTASEKTEMRTRTGADVVDMETHAVVTVCAERGLPCLGIRIISDEASEDLPPEILTITGPTGGFRLGATLGALWKRPGSVKDLWRIYEHAQEAADRLAVVVRDILARQS